MTLLKHGWDPHFLDGYSLGRNPDHFDFYVQFELSDIVVADPELRENLAAVVVRAQGAGREVVLGYYVDHAAQPYDSILAVGLPAGDGQRYLWVDGPGASEILALPFEFYEYLPEHDAVWNPREASVEASIEFFGMGGHKHYLRRTRQPEKSLSLTNGTGLTLRFGQPSTAGQLLLRQVTRLEPEVSASLSLSPLPASSAAEAGEWLTRIGETFLFRHDLATQESAYLVRSPVEEWTPGRKNPELGPPETENPSWFTGTVLPRDPLRLFLYARSVRAEFPLIKFLAYYQVIEFFLPRYAMLEQAEELQKALREEGFDPESITSITAALDQVTKVAKRSEWEQLRATLARSLNIDSLRRTLAKPEAAEVVAALTDDQQPLGTPKIPLGRTCTHQQRPCKCDTEIVTALARRIYGLRNRLVHTKESSSDARPLFPFDFDAARIAADTEVLKFVAASVLLANEINLNDAMAIPTA